MPLTSKSKMALAGAGIFLAGLLAGTVGTALVAKYHILPLTRMDRPGAAGFFMERLSVALKLDDEQRRGILPIVEETLLRIGQARKPCLQAEDEAVAAGAERIRAQLRPEQQGRFDEFLAKVKERRRKIFGS
ncbi:hypothetical protein [Fundidesulfovibrio agrisoli]|uniref:hypothetical protein n=1 Tax=Fundidesulfovibrio agrisoli TaxID=2922717 RepID=UPI001FAC1C4D|nr:hypothetical protein [Fundidesulfovibrio agrisoli]